MFVIKEKKMEVLELSPEELKDVISLGKVIGEGFFGTVFTYRDRLIKLDSFNNYEDILNDLIKKRNMKRLKVTGEDEDDLKFEKLSNKKQKKIRYPKK